MAININTEHTLTLSEAAKVVPRLRRGRKVHVSTLYRWASRGVGGVRLEVVRIGGTLVTSREALQRFAERCSGRSYTTEQKQPELQPNEDLEQTERELDERGL